MNLPEDGNDLKKRHGLCSPHAREGEGGINARVFTQPSIDINLSCHGNITRQMKETMMKVD